jgi:hypothetical protein
VPATSTSPSFITVTASAKRKDPVDVVLDQQHRQIRGDALDELADALAFRRRPVPASGSSSKSTRGRVPRASAMSSSRLPAVRQRRRRRRLHAGQTHRAHHLGAVAVDFSQRGRVDPDRMAPRVARLNREAHVLGHRQRHEQVGDLERATDAGERDLLGAVSRDRPAGERDGAAVRREQSRDQVEGGRLAGAVRADQCMQRPVAQPERHVLDRVDAAEVLGQSFRCEDDLAIGMRRSQESRQRDGAAEALRHGGLADGRLSPTRRGACVQADQAGRREDDEGHEQQPEDEQPVLGDARQRVAKDHEEQRAERGA